MRDMSPYIEAWLSYFNFHFQHCVFVLEALLKAPLKSDKCAIQALNKKHVKATTPVAQDTGL